MLGSAVVLCLIVQVSAQMHSYLLDSIHEIALRDFKSGIVQISDSFYSYNETCNLFNTLQSKSNSISTCLKIDLLNYMLADLHLMKNWSIILLPHTERANEETLSNINSYILISYCEDHNCALKDITQQFQLLMKNHGWNPRARFLVIFTHKDLQGTKLSEELSLILWKRQVIEVIFLVASTENVNELSSSEKDTVLEMRSWLPYGPPGRCANISDTTILDYWLVDKSNGAGSFFNSSILFPNKFPKDFQGCPITVSAFEFAPNIMLKKGYAPNSSHVEFDDGHEYKLFMTLVNYVNLTANFKYNPDQWGWNINGSWDGVTGEVIRGDIVTAPVDFWNKCHLVPEIECSVAFIIDHIKWWVPCPEPYPRWQAMTRVFQPSLWLVFLLAYVSVAICMSIIVTVNYKIDKDVQNQQNQSYTSLVKCMLNFWAVILEESASNNPPHMPAVRAMFLAWVLYCWAVNTVYQSFLTSFMVDPGVQHQLSSQDEVYASDLDIGFLRAIVTIFPELNAKKYRCSTHCENNAECHQRIAYNNNLAVMWSEVNMEYLIASKYITQDNKPLICTFDYVFGTQPVVLPFMKGFPLLPLFDNLILHVLQSGLFDYWWQYLKYVSTLEALKDTETPDGEYVKFSLEHLESAYGFLFLGCIVALLLCIGENIHSKYHSKNPKPQKENIPKQLKTEKFYFSPQVVSVYPRKDRS
ncbi:Ionotropic receptor 212 [Blattella germanica]|nr:Ionotropic receptor 212 [Blattella germanica]